MAWRGQLSRNLKELRILFSPASPSSASTRAFVESNYKDLKTKNPKLPILIRDATGIEPQLWARYDFSENWPMMKRPLWNFLSSLSYNTCSSSDVLKSGDILKQARIFSISDIAKYSKLTHDHNPLHFDLQCARNAGFSDVPVPGLLVASLFPRIIASHFPGAVYVKQTLDFRAPVFVGEEIIGEVQASNIRQVKQKFLVKFATTCFKNGETIVIGGEATAILPALSRQP